MINTQNCELVLHEGVQPGCCVCLLNQDSSVVMIYAGPIGYAPVHPGLQVLLGPKDFKSTKVAMLKEPLSWALH